MASSFLKSQTTTSYTPLNRAGGSLAIHLSTTNVLLVSILVVFIANSALLYWNIAETKRALDDIHVLQRTLFQNGYGMVTSGSSVYVGPGGADVCKSNNILNQQLCVNGNEYVYGNIVTRGAVAALGGLQANSLSSSTTLNVAGTITGNGNLATRRDITSGGAVGGLSVLAAHEDGGKDLTQITSYTDGQVLAMIMGVQIQAFYWNETLIQGAYVPSDTGKIVGFNMSSVAHAAPDLLRTTSNPLQMRDSVTGVIMSQLRSMPVDQGLALTWQALQQVFRRLSALNG